MAPMNPDDLALHLSAIVERAEAASVGDEAFTGAGYDGVAGEVHVWRVGGDKPPEVAARYTRLTDANARVRVLPGVISKKQAEVLDKALSRDHAALRAEGIELQSWGINRGGEPFEIGVRDAQRHEETLLSRYGDAFFGRHTVQVIEMEVIGFAGRLDDSPPWYGGGRTLS
jgi:hypothetical protein